MRTKEDSSEKLRIAIGITLDRSAERGSLREIWWWTGECWRAAGLKTTARTHPEPIAALFALAELNRRKKKPVRTLATKPENPILWSMAERALNTSKTQYLKHIGDPPFGVEPRKGEPHPFFGKWFQITTDKVLVRPQYVSSNNGQILFYDVAGIDSLDSLTPLIGLPELVPQRVRRSDDLRVLVEIFGRRRRAPSGAAVTGRARGTPPSPIPDMEAAAPDDGTSACRSGAARDPLLAEVREYLQGVIDSTARLPKFFPSHLQELGEGRRGFCTIYQPLRFVGWRQRNISTPRPSPDAAAPDGCQAEDHHAVSPWPDGSTSSATRTILLSDPGGGKSWALRKRAYDLAAAALSALEKRASLPDETAIPALCDLPLINRTDDDLEAVVVQALSRGRSRGFRDWIEQQLKAGGLLLLLDGLDEVPLQPRDLPPYAPGYRQRLCQRIEDLARNHEQLSIVVTCRRWAYAQIGLDLGQNQVELLSAGLDDDAKRSFVNTWFGSIVVDTADQRDDSAFPWLGMGRSRAGQIIREDPHIGALCTQPLFLALMCHSMSQEREGIPCPVRSELYHLCLTALLRDRWQSWVTEGPASHITGILDLLSQIAYRMVDGAANEEDAVRFHAIVTDCMEALPSSHTALEIFTPSSFIDMLLESGILMRRCSASDATLTFLHPSFAEYLAATKLAKTYGDSGWWQRIFSMVREPRWSEVLCFLGPALGKHAGHYLTALLRATRDDASALSAGIALRALSEISTERFRLLMKGDTEERLCLCYAVYGSICEKKRVEDSLDELLSRYHGRERRVLPLWTPHSPSRPFGSRRVTEADTTMVCLLMLCDARWSPSAIPQTGATRLGLSAFWEQNDYTKSLAEDLAARGAPRELFDSDGNGHPSNAAQFSLALLRLAGDDAFRDIQSEIIVAISRLACPDVASELMSHIDNDRFRHVQDNLLMAIGTTGDASVCRRLLSRFWDGGFAEAEDYALLAIMLSSDDSLRKDLIDLAELLEERGEHPWFLGNLDTAMGDCQPPLELNQLPSLVRAFYEELVVLWEELANALERSPGYCR